MTFKNQNNFLMDVFHNTEGFQVKLLLTYSSGHKNVYVFDYAVAIVRYNHKRNGHRNRRAVHLPCLI